MKAQETARGLMRAALLSAFLLCGFARSKSATARKGAALFPPCRGRARRRMSHARRNLFKEERKRNPWPDLLDASRATWADDIAARAIRTSSAHIARVAGAIYSAPSTTAERGQNWTYLTPVRAGARGQYRGIKP